VALAERERLFEMLDRLVMPEGTRGGIAREQAVADCARPVHPPR
jgi:hypothetical protein